MYNFCVVYGMKYFYCFVGVNNDDNNIIDIIIYNNYK